MGFFYWDFYVRCNITEKFMSRTSPCEHFLTEAKTGKIGMGRQKVNNFLILSDHRFLILLPTWTENRSARPSARDSLIVHNGYGGKIRKRSPQVSRK